MKILWIYPELPFPLTSGFLRGFHLLRLLGQRHAVSFLSLTNQKQVPPETVAALKPYAERLVIFNKCDAPQTRWRRVCGLLPVLGRRLQESWSTRWVVKQMEMAVHDLLKQEVFDLVLFHGREALPILDKVEVPIVVECGDTNCARILLQMHRTRLWLQPRLFFHYLRARRLEEKLARRTPYRFFISMRDRENLLGPSDQSAIVPQGVDYDYWKRSLPPSGGNCIVFSGVMNYSPNADAAVFLLDTILPLVRRVFSELEVLIVGRDPLPELVNMAQRYTDVTVTGAVDDIRPYLERADVSVAPYASPPGLKTRCLKQCPWKCPLSRLLRSRPDCVWTAWSRNWSSAKMPRSLPPVSPAFCLTPRIVRASPKRAVGLSKLTAPGPGVRKNLKSYA
jgi:hypothetical protein